ncbi:MAG: winged helix-turn-helix domain-containing protein, partial [Peptococcaceae bacterium]|nr:winged helix-turn-helix domain-containing protein [Peptococcaceae bacterium]
AFILDNGEATSAQLAKLTGLTQGRVRAILQKLVADGIIIKVGDNRFASYRIKNKDTGTVLL